jgi:ankyrin repeat protein
MNDWFRAASDGDIPKLKMMLIEAHQLLNSSDSAGLTALHYAVTSGAVSTVVYLLESGADMTRRTKVGETAVLKAAAAGQIHCVETLLRFGASVADSDFSGAGFRAGSGSWL